MADEPLAPMTDWRDRVWAKYDLVVPKDWPAVLLGTPDPDVKPCRPIPCPGSSLGYVEIFDQLRDYVELYRKKMLTSSPVTVYMPQWAVDKLTREQLQLMEQADITIETRW